MKKIIVLISTLSVVLLAASSYDGSQNGFNGKSVYETGNRRLGCMPFL